MQACKWYHWKKHQLISHIIIIRLHSSRMHTARLLTVSPSMHCAGGSARGGSCMVPGGLLHGGVPGLGGGGILACTEAHSPCGQNCWHTLLKILPCPKLRLRAVIKTARAFLQIWILWDPTNQWISRLWVNQQLLRWHWLSASMVAGVKYPISPSCTIVPLP